MLKQQSKAGIWEVVAAAFGRLCVETGTAVRGCDTLGAAAFGRLCVETCGLFNRVAAVPAAAFGRLCVETSGVSSALLDGIGQPPSGGCVLKPI